MPEVLTFANFRLDMEGVEGLYDIGATEDHQLGVAREIADAFEHTLSDSPNAENLGELRVKVGPAKTLRENLPHVQEVLGTNDDAVTIAQGWIERTGLLTAVERSFYNDEMIVGDLDFAVVTGGMRNLMARRAARLITLRDEHQVGKVILVAGTRKMNPTEGPDVSKGMTEQDYMISVLAMELGKLGIDALMVKADSEESDEVMEAGAMALKELTDLKVARLAVVSNAGAWVENAGQLRRAVTRYAEPLFDFAHSQLFAVSDAFPLGDGTRPQSTHQDPFFAVGQIVRNLEELSLHAS